MKHLIFALLLTALLTTITSAAVLNVPAEHATIQTAILASTDGDTVLVADGTYVENINFKGKAITVASHFLMDADTSHISNTIIDGSQPSHPDSGSVVYFISGEDTTSILTGFTITKGTGTIFNSPGGETKGGGGIFCYNSGARISDNKIENNHINFHNALGGGLAGYPMSNKGYIILERNDIVNNSVTGGLIWSSAAEFTCDVTIKNNNISFNTLYNTADPHSPYANGCALSCWNTVNPRFAIIQGNTISHNKVFSDSVACGAGGIDVESWMSAEIVDNVITYNELNSPKAERGGGIMLFQLRNGSIIDRNVISHNRSGSGGGIYLYECRYADVIITNNIISNNESISGAGIYSTDSRAVIINNTIINNSARSYGGGIVTGGANKSIIFNSIIWGNQAGKKYPQIFGSPIVNYCNIEGEVWDGEGNFSADPMVVLGDPLFHLSEDSPCIGKGVAKLTINGSDYTAPLHDYSGNSRPATVDEFIDLGAHESDHLGTAIERISASFLTNYHLYQNYPNPFNPSTTIKYNLPQQSHVELAIYNMNGQKVSTLVSEQLAAGAHQAIWNAEAFPSGVYWYQLNADDFVQAKKLLLLK